MDPTLPSSTQPSDVLMKPPSDIMNDPLIEPVSSQTETTPASDVVSEPSDDFVDLTNNLMTPDDIIVGVSAVADSAKDTTEIPLDEPSDEFVDILGSETEAQREEVVVADVSVGAATDKSEVTSNITDPHGDAQQEVKETFTAPIIDISSDLSENHSQPPPATDKIVDPLVDLLSDPPPTEAKKPSSRSDLFEEEGSDLFAEPWQTKSAKQPQKSLFGEPDEDLFSEPLGATTKKPISKEQKDKSVPTKAAAAGGSNICGPLQESNQGEPADIFTEEAIATTPSISNTSSVNSKTNGVHSEEDTDIFSGGCLVTGSSSTSFLRKLYETFSSEH